MLALSLSRTRSRVAILAFAFALAPFLTLLALPFSAGAQETARFDPKLVKQANALMDLGLEDEIAYEIIESLTTEVGPRLAGSDAEARARDWAVAKLKKMGFKNVHVEPFEVTLWQRHFESARIIAPFPQPLTLTALGGSIATPEGGVEADVVRFRTLFDLEAAPLTGFEGKIIFVDEPMARTQDGSGYGVAVRKRSGAAQAAGKRGAAAVLIRSVGTDHHRFAHTGMMRYDPAIPAVPIAALSAPDADQLARALTRAPVTLSMTLDVGTVGTVQSGNVIAEIPGRTDEVVILGGHLDSWDLGTGAIDDGAGVGITIGAANLVKNHQRKPKRTIRIILWGAEEVGLVGAFAYAEAHKDELDKFYIGSESDFGAGKIWRVRTQFGEGALGFAEAFTKLFARFGLAQGDNMGEGGPDMIPLARSGVPALDLNQNGYDYFDLHHTADDTFDKIALEDVQQNVAIWAGFLWVAANMEGDLRKPSNTTENQQ